MKAFSVEAFEHVIDGLVRVCREHDTLPLLAEPFHNLGNDACLAGARRTLHQQVILHLQRSLDRQVLLCVKIMAWRNVSGLKLWSHFACHECAQMGVSLQPAQQVLHRAHMDNVRAVTVDQPGMGDEFRDPDAYLLRADTFDIAGHYFAGYRVSIAEQYFIAFT